MHVVLWDTLKLNASKDFAGGFGVGTHPRLEGIRGRLIRYFFTRDRRPVALLYAHLASVFRQLGHRVRYVVDRIPSGADLYVFCPSLITLRLERRAMARVLARNPAARVLVVGMVPTVMPEAFDGLEVTVVKGEAEQLLWRLDEVLQRPAATVQLGTLADLDLLPMPDWSPFRPGKFRIGYDFWRFPTALVQASRGCTFKCNYCPYTVQDNTTRFRDPEAVADEIRHGVRQWGFRSFKFRDPLFGLNRRQVFRLAELIGRMPRKIQFSIETRIDLMPSEVLRVLRRVGLTSMTVGIETPDEQTLRQYHRRPVADDRQREFIADCRRMGIRTVAGFLIGFPDDTEASIIRTNCYAKLLNPTFANFNVVTPYPGTEFFERMAGRIAHFDYSRYTVYAPVLQYKHLSAGQLSRLHANCFRNFYFRWRYIRDNAPFLWPRLQALGIGPGEPGEPAAEAPHPGVPRPLSGLDVLHRKGLRTDGPHHRGGVGQRASERRPEE